MTSSILMSGGPLHITGGYAASLLSTASAKARLGRAFADAWMLSDVNEQEIRLWTNQKCSH